MQTKVGEEVQLHAFLDLGTSENNVQKRITELHIYKFAVIANLIMHTEAFEKK
jgi:hypothetical protein